MANNTRNPLSSYVPTDSTKSSIINTPIVLKGGMRVASSLTTSNNVRITPTMLSRIQWLDISAPLSTLLGGASSLSAIASNLIATVTNSIDIGSLTKIFRNLFVSRIEVTTIHFNTSAPPIDASQAEQNTLYCNPLGDLFYATKNVYKYLSIDPGAFYYKGEVDNLFTDKLANYTLTTDFNNKTSQYQTINNSDTAIGLCAKLAGNNTFSGDTVFSGTNVKYTTAITNGNNSTQVCTTAYTDRQSFENTVFTTNAAYASPASLFMNNTIIYSGTTNAIFTLTPPIAGYIGQTFNIYSTVNFTIKVSSGYSFNTIMGKGTFLNGNNGPTIVAYTQYIFKYAGDTNSVRWVYY